MKLQGDRSYCTKLSSPHSRYASLLLCTVLPGDWVSPRPDLADPAPCRFLVRRTVTPLNEMYLLFQLTILKKGTLWNNAQYSNAAL